MTLDEFEDISLADLEGMLHAPAAKLMKVSRLTFTGILARAHEKVADGMVNIGLFKLKAVLCEKSG